MPIYEYICENKTCEHKFEELQKLSDQPLEKCPKCKKKTLKKIISSGHFKI